MSAYVNGTVSVAQAASLAHGGNQGGGKHLHAAPANTLPPVISGTAQQGQTLTTSAGSWSNGASSYGYQWQDCSTTACTDIVGATSSSYTLAAPDVGDTVDVVVTATNSGGSASATSAQTTAVLPPSPTSSAPPVVSGSARQGSMLATTNGAWTNGPSSYNYQWQDCSTSGCTGISGATSPSYMLKSSDVGAKLDVVVTANNAGGSASATSAPTTSVMPASPANTALPVIGGTAQQGQTLTTTNGSWSNSPTSYGYQWQDCTASGCVNVVGATSSSYTLAASDLGDTIDVVVTASNAGGSTSATSLQSGNVTSVPAPSNSALPVVSGTAQQGQTLTTTNGSWNGSPTSFGYQWQDCTASGCTNISGATGSNYTLAASDVGDKVDVVIAATNSGGSTLASSAQTTTVLPPAPTSNAPPVVSGSAQQGQTLATTNGSWNGSPTGYAYQWQDCTTSGCTNIPGATGSSYTLAASDVGDTLDVVVTARNAGGSVSATSAQTASVLPAAPSNAGLPVISGTAQQGQTLTTTNGSWNGGPTSYAYQWQDCTATGCTNIAGATSSSYTLVASDVGDTIDVVVAASNAGGSALATSARSASVAGVVLPSNSALPVVSGTAQQGQTLTTTNGSWNGSPTGYAYQWQDCTAAGCTNISGATGSSYTLTSSDVGETVDVVVTASNAGGSTPATSAQTASVKPAAPSNTALPAVSGTAQQGQTLTTTNGSWSNSPTSYSYQWQDCTTTNCTNIAGATSSSYTLASSDVGQTIDVVVAASNAGGSALATSARSGSVTGVALPSNSALPVVSGSAQQGQTLSTTIGSWSGSPTGYAYQWQDCTTSGCSNISGATSSSYTLAAADVGDTVDVVVTARNAGGSTSATSAQSAKVTPPSPPSNTALPAISGSAQQGQTLTTSNGSWSNSPASYSYQWQDCNSSGALCSNIAGATSSSYTVGAADVNHTIVAVVTATNAGGSTSATATATSVVPDPSSSTFTLDPSFQGSTYYEKFSNGLCRFDPQYPSDNCQNFFPMSTWAISNWSSGEYARIKAQWLSGIYDNYGFDSSANFTGAQSHGLWYAVNGDCQWNPTSPSFSYGGCSGTTNPRTANPNAWNAVVAAYALGDEPDTNSSSPYHAGNSAPVNCVSAPLPGPDDPCTLRSASDTSSINSGDAAAYGSGGQSTRLLEENFTKGVFTWNSANTPGWTATQYDTHLTQLMSHLTMILDDVYGWTDQYEWSQCTQSQVQAGAKPNGANNTGGACANGNGTNGVGSGHYGAWVYGQSVDRVHALDPHSPKLPVSEQIECCGGAQPGGLTSNTNVITPDMLDAAMWNVLVHGGQGFDEIGYDWQDWNGTNTAANVLYPDAPAYFNQNSLMASHVWDSNYNQIQADNMLTQAFAPWLNAPTVAGLSATSNLTQSGTVPVSVLGKQITVNGSNYLWVAAQADGNAGNQMSNLSSLTGTIQLPSTVPAGSVFDVYGENRTVTVNGGHQIVDTFGTVQNDVPNYTSRSGTAFTDGPLEYGYAHHIYYQAGAAADATAKPLVAINLPNSDPTVATTVSGATVHLAANAADPIGVSSVQFMLDGTNIGSAVTAPDPLSVTTGAPTSYSMNWNSTSVANGAHTLTAVVTDTNGNTATSSSIPITVNNASAATSPTVSLTASPTTSASPGAPVTLSWASANTNDAATKCEEEPWDGSMATSGSMTVKPQATTTYSVVCIDASNHAAVANVTVPVTGGTPW